MTWAQLLGLVSRLTLVELSWTISIGLGLGLRLVQWLRIRLGTLMGSTVWLRVMGSTLNWPKPHFTRILEELGISEPIPTVVAMTSMARH
ncbi:hypothetical protein V6N13_025655 [Hibiscus sabdariffa]